MNTRLEGWLSKFGRQNIFCKPVLCRSMAWSASFGSSSASIGSTSIHPNLSHLNLQKCAKDASKFLFRTLICTCFPSTQWGAELKQSSRVDTEVNVANLKKNFSHLSKEIKSSNSPKTTTVAIREALDTHFLNRPPKETKIDSLAQKQ